MRQGEDLPRFVEDSEKPSPFSAEDMNRLIDRANAWNNPEIRRGARDEIIISDKKVIFQLARFATGSSTPVSPDEDPEDGEINAGTDDTVYVIRKFPDGHLYAGGLFTLANAFSRTRLASFRQTLSLRSPSWFIGDQKDGDTIIGGYLANYVQDIAQRTGNLFYAAGGFILGHGYSDDDDPMTGTGPVNNYVKACNVVMLTLSGLIDPSFDPPAFKTRDLNIGGGATLGGNIRDAHLFAVQTANFSGAPDSVLIAGDFDEVGGVERHSLIGLKDDGTRYTGFDAGLGFNFKRGDGAIIPLGCIYILPDASGSGWYVAAHSFGGDKGRVDPTGSPVDCSPCGLSSNTNYLYYQGDRAYGGLCRINPDGSRDTGFDAGSPGSSACGVWCAQDVGLTGLCKPLCQDASGNIYVAQTDPLNLMMWWDGADWIRQTLVKMDDTGALDTTFDSTAFDAIHPYIDGIVYCAALSLDGAFLYIGGYFGTVGGTGYAGFAKLDASTGDVDTTFPNLSVSGGPDVSVKSIVMLGDGSICIGGSFSQLTDPVDGVVSRNNIARITPTGRVL